MRKRNVTSIDVARLAGVSQSTISRVFSPGAKVSEKTREKVLQAAKQLGYKPNAIARGLITHSTKMIGFVTGNLANPFYNYVLDEFTSQLLKKGYYLLYLKTNRDEISEEDVTHFLEYNVDGIIVTHVDLSISVASLFKQHHIPSVLFNRYREKDCSDFNIVSCNNYRAGYEIGKYLIKQGHKKMAYIAGVPHSSTNEERYAGYVAALKERDMHIHNMATGNYTYQGGAEAAMGIFKSKKDRPDAIFCANDLMAMGTIDTARDLGLRIPEDVSVIGFDDIDLAKLPTYSLTTWHHPITEMVTKALDVLFDTINGKADVPVKILVDGKLVERKSVKKLS